MVISDTHARLFLHLTTFALLTGYKYAFGSRTQDVFFSSLDSFCKSEQLRCIKQIDGDANWILLLLLQHLQLIGT